MAPVFFELENSRGPIQEQNLIHWSCTNSETSLEQRTYYIYPPNSKLVTSTTTTKKKGMEEGN